jgi:integrase/recombinase XerD
MAMNPAREVQTERFSRLNGKTPAFHEGEVATLLAAIDPSTPVGLRDRALLATLAYTFREKGGKEKELPVHHQLEQVLDDYLLKTKLSEEPEAPLFPAAKAGVLSRRPINRVDAAEMIKRRLRQAGLPEHYSAHSFRAAGVTNFLENGGSLEVAQRIAGHADSRTTKLYDRRAEKLLVEDMERIRY